MSTDVRYIKQDKTRQNKTKQYKTIQKNKFCQIKTNSNMKITITINSVNPPPM